jgi:hypothetical protein
MKKHYSSFSFKPYLNIEIIGKISWDYIAISMENWGGCNDHSFENTTVTFVPSTY